MVNANVVRSFLIHNGVLIQGRVAQGRQQDLHRLSLQNLEQLVLACCQGVMQTK